MRRRGDRQIGDNVPSGAVVGSKGRRQRPCSRATRLLKQDERRAARDPALRRPRRKCLGSTYTSVRSTCPRRAPAGLTGASRGRGIRGQAEKRTTEEGAVTNWGEPGAANNPGAGRLPSHVDPEAPTQAARPAARPAAPVPPPAPRAPAGTRAGWPQAQPAPAPPPPRPTLPPWQHPR